MGLSISSCQKAFEILSKINPKVSKQNGELKDYGMLSEDNPNIKKVNVVFGYDRKSDGSWENVFMNIRNITKKQSAMFEELKGGIHNTSFCQKPKDGITCLGWI